MWLVKIVCISIYYILYSSGILYFRFFSNRCTNLNMNIRIEFSSFLTKEQSMLSSGCIQKRPYTFWRRTKKFVRRLFCCCSTEIIDYLVKYLSYSYRNIPLTVISALSHLLYAVSRIS